MINYSFINLPHELRCIDGSSAYRQKSKNMTSVRLDLRTPAQGKFSFTMSKIVLLRSEDHSEFCVFLVLEPNRIKCVSLNLISKSGWWSQTGSNRRPTGCKPVALPTELWPLYPQNLKSDWWAWVDSNYRPHAYQACALTT